MKLFIMCSLLFVGFIGFAQSNKPLKKPAPAVKRVIPKVVQQIRRGQIKLIVSPNNQSVKLRWAVTDPVAWSICNKYGYQIERYTVSRNGKILPKLEYKVLNKSPMKPLPLKDWETIATENDYAAVMAQALYGDSFTMSMNNNETNTSPVAKFNTRTAEIQQRFGAFYFSADFNFKAACIGACGFEDTSVNMNEKYLYRVYSLVPPKNYVLDTAISLCSPNEKIQLPKISEVITVFGNKTVTLGWNHLQSNGKYTAYFIDRRKDGEDSFKRITPIPFSVTTNKDAKGNSSPMLYFKDTLGENYVKYFYRIVGTNPFSEFGPYSDTLGGMGAEMLAFAPNISGVDFDSAGKVIINWEFEQEGEKLIKGFQLKFAPQIDSPYVKVLDITDPHLRTIKYDIKDNVGYFVVEALPYIGDGRKSFPYLIQPEDSIPPLSPKEFKGWIDSSGLVIMNWKPNLEKDLMGYRLFKKYVGSNEYSIVNDSLIRDTVFFDMVNVNMINKNVHYAIRAYDKHFNASDPFEIVIRKPDIIPPSPPIFSSFIVKQDSVLITWINSRDEDVVKNILLRKNGFEDVVRWDTISVLKQDSAIQTTFRDTKIKNSTNYAYAIIAEDADGNKSAIVNVLKIKTAEPKLSAYYKITSILANRDSRKINIKWELLPLASTVKIQEIQLYKGEGENKMFLYKILNPKDNTYTDTDLTINTKYKYAIRAVIEGGMPSEFTISEIIY